nr:hypothetical protein [Pectobacterium parmentieri]
MIRWPDDKTLSVRLYLSFLIEVTELLNINFYEDNNPIKITKKYLGRLITNEDRKLALSYWWQCIDDKNIRNFKDRSSLMSRLAICFLSINEENIDEVSEYLSWFIEVLGFLSFNLSEVITFMGEYFEFKSNVDENV